jgi:hypothetical protein
MAELADAADSKSAGLRPLGVRFPLPAPLIPQGFPVLIAVIVDRCHRALGNLQKLVNETAMFPNKG